MEPQVWSKIEDKVAVIFALRDDEVCRILYSGGKVKQEVARITGALQQGQEPSTIGGGSLASMKLASISRAEVSPDRSDIEIHGESGQAPLKFVTGGKQAAEIVRSIIARTGRPFREGMEEVSAGEALIKPVVLGIMSGLAWALVFWVAGRIEAGENVEAGRGGGRGRGFMSLAIWIAGMLGYNGTIAVGVGLLVLFVGWSVLVVVRRPQKTVWRPETA